MMPSNEGYFNAAHVIKITTVKGGKGGSVLHLIDGTTVVSWRDAEHLAELINPVVQALPGYEFLSADMNNDSYDSYDSEPIIAWRIGYDEPLPVTATGAESCSNPSAIRLPNGKVHLPYIATFQDAESWLAYENEQEKHRRLNAERQTVKTPAA